MAENAANFTFTYENKPSIFELIAQKSLNETLQPALQKVALVLATNFPTKFGFLNNYYEETFSVINGLLQYYYLRYYDSSFSENFYGLKRILLNNQPITEHERELSLIFLVIIPYFKRKLEEKLMIYRLENAEGCLRNNMEGRFKKFLIHSQGVLELVWGLVTLHNYLRYMANKTEVQLPIFNFINVKLSYFNEEYSPGFWSAIFKSQFSLSQLNMSVIRNGISGVFGFTAFFLQFLQTWNAQRSNYNITDLPKVPPPPLHNRAKIYEGKCPICLKRWQIPTILPISGYIFCFRCILKYLNEHQKCPVTNLPGRALHLVRLYLSD